MLTSQDIPTISPYITVTVVTRGTIDGSSVCGGGASVVSILECPGEYGNQREYTRFIAILHNSIDTKFEYSTLPCEPLRNFIQV